MTKAFPNRKILLLSFLFPFVLATAGYHLVYVCDAGVRSMGLDQRYPNVPISKAVELEEENRWKDTAAWGVHALVIGLPVGLFCLGISATANWFFSRRGKAGDAALSE
jgi:hypothetical protein